MTVNPQQMIDIKHDVVICIHNGHDDVHICLQSLLPMWNEEGLNKLILIDDASDARMGLYLKDVAVQHSFVEVVSLPTQHFYTRAANAGLRRSSASLVTLLNSDTIVTPGWARSLRKTAAAYPTIGIIGPLSNAASTQSVPFFKSSATQTAINSIPEGVSLPEFADFIRTTAAGRPVPFVPLVHGFCLTITSEVFGEIGLFDEESFPRGYGEENDFCFRAEDAGFILAIATDSYVFHSKSKSYSSDERITYMKNGMQQLITKHSERRVKDAVEFMELNPHLQYIRQKVLNNWSWYYKAQDNLT